MDTEIEYSDSVMLENFQYWESKSFYMNLMLKFINK